MIVRCELIRKGRPEEEWPLYSLGRKFIGINSTPGSPVKLERSADFGVPYLDNTFFLRLKAASSGQGLRLEVDNLHALGLIYRISPGYSRKESLKSTLKKSQNSNCRITLIDPLLDRSLAVYVASAAQRINNPGETNYLFKLQISCSLPQLR